MSYDVDFSYKLMPELFKSVEDNNADRVITLLGLDPKEIYRYVFESASLVIGLKDLKTCIEICMAPEMISVWQEELNPIFN